MAYLEPEQLKAYKDGQGNHCLYCKEKYSVEMTGEEWQSEGLWAEREVHCLHCDEVWKDYYDLTGVTTEDGSTFMFPEEPKLIVKVEMFSMEDYNDDRFRIKVFPKDEEDAAALLEIGEFDVSDMEEKDYDAFMNKAREYADIWSAELDTTKISDYPSYFIE